jgi:integrase
MAGISHDKNGTRRCTFTNADGERMTIRLGRMADLATETFRAHVESIIASQVNGLPIDPKTARWLAELPDKMHARLARAGLDEPREKKIKPTLGRLLDEYFDSLSVKPGTRTTYLQTRSGLESHFGPGRALASISPLEMDQWRSSMVGSGLAPATISKRIKVARSIFAKAVRWQLIDESPAQALKAGAQTNPARKVFVDRETISAVLDAAPDTQWRLLISLGRFGGLRVPSEALALEWEDINWEQSRIRVRSSKTEHHEGGSERIIPIFPELRDLLLEVFAQANEGETRIITQYRDGANLNTQLRRIIVRAGFKPWPRTWHNLRASRATELAQQFPGHVAAAWLGHSERIADQHYRMIRDEDFAKAVAESVTESGAQASQKASMHQGDTKRNEVNNRTQPPHSSGLVRLDSRACASVQSSGMTPGGFEPPLPG